MIELRSVAASDLRPNPKNWRTHPREQAAALRGVLAEVGIADAVLARELADGSLMLIDGHLRANVLPDQNIPVLVLDVDEGEADKLLLMLDPLAAMAGSNTEMLRELMENVATSDESLAAMLEDVAAAAGIIPAERSEKTAEAKAADCRCPRCGAAVEEGE